jgi:hypothetical protein
MMDKVDVLIPTAGKRVDGLIYQINAFVDQSYKHKRIWVLIDVDDEAKFHVLRARIFDRTRRYAPIDIIRVPKEYRGKHGHGPIKYAIERLDLDGDWIITSGDDDSVMPWALEELIKASSGVDMVIGKVIPVRRDHKYLPNHVLGEDITHGHVTGSCCLYRTEKIKTLGYDDSRYDADWDMIEKMKRFPFNKIDTILFVMPQSFE